MKIHEHHEISFGHLWNWINLFVLLQKLYFMAIKLKEPKGEDKDKGDMHQVCSIFQFKMHS